MENQVTYTSPGSMGLPPGYRFCPSKKQLIVYLIKKIIGKPIPHNTVKDCDVYGDPMIWRTLFEETRMKTLYFYTKLKNRQKGKRVARTTEFGTWRGEGNIRIYDDDDDDDDDDDEKERDDFNERERTHIGSRTTFSFAEKNTFKHNAKWTMHEYKLDGIYKNMQNEDEYVICQINKIIKKRRVTKDNPHKNIQDKRAQPLELMGSAFENSNQTESSHQNIQDERAQPLDKDVRGELMSNGQYNWATKDNSHQNIQYEGAQDIDIWGNMDTCPSPNVYSGNWSLDTSYSQDILMNSANGDSEWTESLWEI